MDDGHNHNTLIDALSHEYQDVLANSEQGVYILLDDASKICNKKFATLLGYASESEWAELDGSFPDLFVAEDSQEVLISAFQDAMEKGIASTKKITWKKKDGNTIDTRVILVPISYEGHLLALHFVTST